MSIWQLANSTGRARGLQHADRDLRGASTADQSTDDQPGDAGSALEALTRFFPTETIALFTSVAAVIASWDLKEPNSIYLTWLVVCFVLTEIAYVLGTLTAGRKASQNVFVPYVVWRAVAIAVAFTIWAAAISPGTASALFAMLHKPDNNVSHGSVTVAAFVAAYLLTYIDNYAQTFIPKA